MPLAGEVEQGHEENVIYMFMQDDEEKIIIMNQHDNKIILINQEDSEDNNITTVWVNNKQEYEYDRETEELS
jgi:hypothetical protein